MNRRQAIKAGVAVAAGAMWKMTPETAAAESTYALGGARGAAAEKRAFEQESKRIYERHFAQTRETVAELKRKYAKPLLGRVRVWDQIDQLALCVDASDYNLACTNQLIHVQQVVQGMERDGVTSEDLYLAALLHDLGKVLLVKGEAQENVVCANTPIGDYADGAGLDHVVFQWNHDEFIYSRLKDHLPDHLAWLLRYHSILIEKCQRYMDERDRRYTETYLRPFRRYDMGTKSIWRLPPADILDKYRPLIEKSFPAPVGI